MPFTPFEPVRQTGFIPFEPEQPEVAEAQPKEPGFFERVGGAFKGGVEQAEKVSQESRAAAQAGELTPLEAASEGVLVGGAKLLAPTARAAGEAVKPVFEAIDPAIKFTENILTKLTGNAVKNIQNFLGREQIEKINQSIETIAKDPEVKRGLELAGIGLEGLVAPVGALETGALAGGVKQVAKAGIKAAAPLVKEAVGKAADIARKTVQEFPEIIKKVGAKVTAKETRKGLGTSIIESTQKVNPTDAKKFLAKSNGQTIGEFLQERGIVTTREKTVNKLADRFKNLKKNLDDATDLMTGKHQDIAVQEVLDANLKRLGKTTGKGKTARSGLLSRMRELDAKHKNEGLTPSEINETKRVFEREVRIADKGDVGVGADIRQLNTDKDDAIREFLFNVADEQGLPNMRDINKEIQLSREAADAIAGKLEGQKANNLVTLTDSIILAPAVSNPALIAGYIGKKAFGTETLKSFIAKAISPKGKKKLPDIDLEQIAIKMEARVAKEGLEKASQIRKALIAEEYKKKGLVLGEDFIIKDVGEVVTPDKGLGKAGIAEKSLPKENVAFHGTQAKIFEGKPRVSKGTMGEAFYLSDNSKEAKRFGKDLRIKNKEGRLLRKPSAFKDSNVFEFNLSDLNIKKFKNDADFFEFVNDPEIEKVFKLGGYDGSYIKDSGTYAIYNVDKLKKIN